MDTFEMYNKINPDNGNLIKELTEQKLNRLERNISEINSLIEERIIVSKDVIKDFDKQALDARNEVFRLDTLAGYNKINLDSLAHSFKNKITELEVEKVKEHVNAWRDLVILKQKQIDNVNELDAVKNRIKLFNNIKKNDSD